jgi:hypothetical protein
MREGIFLRGRCKLKAVNHNSHSLVSILILSIHQILFLLLGDSTPAPGTIEGKHCCKIYWTYPLQYREDLLTLELVYWAPATCVMTVK